MHEKDISFDRMIDSARLVFLLMIVPAIILTGAALSFFSFESYISSEASRYNQIRVKSIERWWQGHQGQNIAEPKSKMDSENISNILDAQTNRYPWAIYSGSEIVLQSENALGRFVSDSFKLGDSTFVLKTFYEVPFFTHLFSTDFVILIVPLAIMMAMLFLLVEVFFGHLQKINKGLGSNSFHPSEALTDIKNLLMLESTEREIIQDERDFLRQALDQFAAYAVMDMQGYFLQMNHVLLQILHIDTFSPGFLSFESILNNQREFVLMLHQLHKSDRWQGEICIRRTDGGYSYLDATILQHSNKLVLFANDITIRKEFESEMLAARNEALSGAMAKSRFLANMSHEIRTPLNGILGMLELIKRDANKDKQEERLIVIQQSAEHLLSVLNDVLDFSKIEAGKISIEHIRFNLRDLCSRTLSLFELKGQEKGLDVIFDWPEDVDGMVIGDPTRIGQILNNLLSNAIKFTNKGFVSLRVYVEERRDVSKWNIAVLDSGTGIKDVDQNKIFGSFSQVDGSISRKYGGTGLGLAISKNLAQIMGGDLDFNSEWGIGTEFNLSLYLPNDSGHPNYVIADVENQFLPHGWKNDLKVLVAEDNDINQMVVANFLSMLGINSDWAKTGKEALDALEHKNYDLILMDVQMPEMDGLVASRIIRHERGNSQVVIIALTANSSEEDKAQAINAGMNDFLSKPFRMAELELKLLKYFPINKSK